MSSASESVLVKLKEHGLLLQTDANLPNVCALVVGAPIRGSWWAHPLSHDIFAVNCVLAAHPDVLVVKLISGKVTYLHRALWPAFLAIGRARESWQIERLSHDQKLDELQTLTGLNVQPVQVKTREPALAVPGVPQLDVPLDEAPGVAITHGGEHQLILLHRAHLEVGHRGHVSAQPRGGRPCCR